jgi:hypothetical protein
MQSASGRLLLKGRSMITVDPKDTEGFRLAQAQLNAESLRLIPDDVSDEAAQNLMRALPKLDGRLPTMAGQT